MVARLKSKLGANMNCMVRIVLTAKMSFVDATVKPSRSQASTNPGGTPRSLALERQHQKRSLEDGMRVVPRLLVQRGFRKETVWL